MQNKKTLIFRKITITALFVGIYFLGYLHGHQNLKFEKNHTPELVNLELKKPTTVDFSKFWEVYNKIEEDYIDPIDSAKALEGSIRGLVDSLDDPYSVYLSKQESKEFLDDLNGTFEGIGAELTIKDNIITVVTPLDDSPAHKAGLKTKDKIIAINGEDATKLSLEEAVSKIRGKRGTKVQLTIVSDGEKNPKDITIIRDSIKASSVSYKTEDNLAILRINQFADDSIGLMQKYAGEIIKDKNIKGIILDLRNNPGGLLESSIDISSLFIGDSKTIVIQQDRKGNKKEKKTTLEPILKDYPLAVLINEGSASASEIVSGAISDHQRGKIIGINSYGKGSVQDLMELEDGSTLKLTIEKWLTPNGETISHKGIKPEIEVTDDEKTEEDEVLLKAKEVLK